MSEPVIAVRDLSKAYSIYDKPLDVLKEAVFGGQRHDVFWALRDVNLDIREGQRVGIIGPNGAGKSTLLKIITGNLAPSTGTVEVRGSISAMLSLTSFLDPEQTGLENIRFNLIVNETPRSDIPRLTEEIIDFTELGAFIRAPVRTYSSGMNARLAFAISTAMTPDILVVDEVLGAGDAYFASKATMRMIDLCKQGRALLFVSHAMNAVQLLCDTVIWMDNGQIREIGPVDEIARRYEADFRRQEDEHLRAGNAKRASELTNRVRPEELGRPDVWRLRLVGTSGRVHDTHYVRRVVLSIAGHEYSSSLDFRDIDDPGVVICLDLAGSEWGRHHQRLGQDTRALAPGSSALRGGHLLVRPPLGTDVADLPFDLSIETTSLGATEQLTAQVADAPSGAWLDLPVADRKQIGGGWERARFGGTLVSTDEAIRIDHVNRVVEDLRPDVEVVETRFLVDSAEALSVTEGEPFEIAVTVSANALVAAADVWLKFTRADGFYVFWQSSGQVGQNLSGFEGIRVVTFHFEPNLFGAGDYEVEVTIGNGFDVERNWPHSQVFDRRVGALKFTVARKWKLVMFGPVNYRFPVSVATPEPAGTRAPGHIDA